MIRMIRLIALLAAGAAACAAIWAAGLRPGYLFDPAPKGHRIASASPALTDQRPLRIAVLGTSLTARYAWPEGLRAGLEACLGRPAEIAKTAKAGAGSDWGVEAAAGVAADQPDLTLIEFSINDADLSDWVRGGGASLEGSRRRHLAMIDALRAANPAMRIALVTMSPAHGPRGWVRPFLGAHEDMYRRLAEGMDLDLIDLAPLWAAALEGGADTLPPDPLPDGLHPTEAAVTEVALPAMIAQAGEIVGAGC